MQYTIYCFLMMLSTLLFWLNIKGVFGEVNDIYCGRGKDLHVRIICQNDVCAHPNAKQREQS